METVTAPPDDSAGANPSSVKSDDSSPRPESGRESPPPNCAICLGTCRNKSFTDSCLHQFCFKCLLTWSKVKAECPLCKQNFKSIIHNVRSNHQYEEYLVEQQQTEESVDRNDIVNLTTATRRFRYRTTLTLPRRESLAIQQLLLHYPLMADVFPPPAPAPPPSAPAAAPAPRRRRRSPAAFRRTVYRHNLWARPLPDFTGRFRDCTPQFYRYNDSQMHRLIPWLNRELHYLLNENVGHISYVITRILDLLPQYPINSNEFRENMQRYFGDRTELFLHELYVFASTPYDITGYDRNVQYTTDSRISTMVNEVLSSSDSDASIDSDIVMISSSHPAPAPAPAPAAAGPSRPAATAPPTNVIPIETISHSDTDDSGEVMVVGYIKPPQERTPEVVDLLGSDSDVVMADPEPASTSLVHVSLKRHAARRSSDSDSSYRPLPTTSDTSRTTPDVPPSPPPQPSAPSTSPSPPRRRRPKKRQRRRSRSSSASPSPERERRKRRKRASRSRRSDGDSRSKRKSQSGKGVKSSRRRSESTDKNSPVRHCDEPGPSETSHNSRIHSRLRSVVTTASRSRSAGDSNSSAGSNLLNILSSAILDPNSNVLAYNSDSGSVADEDRTKARSEAAAKILEKAESCFKVNRNSTSDSDDSNSRTVADEDRTKARSEAGAKILEKAESCFKVNRNSTSDSDDSNSRTVADEDRTKARSEASAKILEKAESCFKINRNSTSDSDDSNSRTVADEDRTKARSEAGAEILEKSESCFKVNPSSTSDSDDDLPLNLSLQKKSLL